MIVKHTDSLTKIVEYLTKVSINPIEFNGKTFPTYDKFTVSATLFRRFACPPNCGGCCPRFTLDYFTDEEDTPADTKRSLTVNGIEIPVWSYIQGPEAGKLHCDFVGDEGRCSIHTVNPFSCQTEPIKWIAMKNHVYLSKRPFGRGWAMNRVDGEKGALCEFHEDEIEQDFEWTLRIMNKLQWIADQFKLDTYLGAAIEYVENVQEEFKKGNRTTFQNYVIWDRESGFHKYKKPPVLQKTIF